MRREGVAAEKIDLPVRCGRCRTRWSWLERCDACEEAKGQRSNGAIITVTCGYGPQTVILGNSEPLTCHAHPAPPRSSLVTGSVLLCSDADGTNDFAPPLVVRLDALCKF